MQTTNQPASRPARRRGLALGLALLASPLAAEALLRLPGGYRADLARGEIEQRMERVLGSSIAPPGDEADRDLGAQDGNTRELHPYFGYEQGIGQELIERYVQQHHREDREAIFTVLICGGSVAETFIGNAKGGADELVRLLADEERIAGRKIKICRLARSGYKQPQQLQKLSYFLSRGCAPDVVINIDGLNEMRGGLRNLEYGVPPSFPPASHWQHLVLDVEKDEGAMLALMDAQQAKLAFLQRARATLDSWQLSSAVLGRMAERPLERAFADLVAAEDRYTQALAVSAGDPPPLTDEDLERAQQECLETWAQSSRLMHALCQSVGSTYLHCLQPTLHDPGSKPIAEQERRVGIGSKGLDPLIAEYYVLLRERGAQLAAEGVPFVDTSRIFAEVREPLYHDRAHFGKAGNRILAEHMAAELIARL